MDQSKITTLQPAAVDVLDMAIQRASNCKGTSTKYFAWQYFINGLNSVKQTYNTVEDYNLLVDDLNDLGHYVTSRLMDETMPYNHTLQKIWDIQMEILDDIKDDLKIIMQ